MSLLEWLKIWSKFYSLPLFCNTEYPPPPRNENCQKSWHFDFSVAEYPPPQKWKLSEILALWLFSCRIPPPKLKLRQILELCDFSSADYPPPPENWNLGRSWNFVIFQVQITPPTPPENWNLGRSWHFVIFQVQITPPPRKLKLRQILELCDFSSADYPPPPENWNLGRSWNFVIFQVQITPPENWNLGRSWNFVIFQVQITPPLKIET